MAIQAVNEGDTLFNAGTRAVAALSANAQLFARYDGQFRRSYRADALAGGFKALW